jgi:uncharacterized repeat protein (TIGR03803 family)
LTEGLVAKGLWGATQGADGNFYGVATYDGANGKGLLFRFSPAGAFTVLCIYRRGRTPYRADLDPNDVRKTAYYAMRWVNTRGNPGPWSEITSYPII